MVFALRRSQMFKISLKQSITEFHSIKTCIFILILTFCSAGKIKSAQSCCTDIWNYIVYILSDQYLMIYLFFTILFFIMAKMAFKQPNIVMIRYKNSFIFWINQVFSCFTYSFLLFVSFIFILFIIGSFSFTYISPTDYLINTTSVNDIPTFYFSQFHNDIVCTFAVIGFTIFGLFFLSIIINFLNAIFKKRLYTVSIIAMYLSMFIGFRLNINKYVSLLFLHNYLFLYYSLNNNITLLTIIITLIISFLLILFIKKYWWYINDSC